MIYRNSGGVLGQPPLNFKNYSGSIQDYLIEGNTSQNGTPSPANPVDVVGCGVKTVNLFDKVFASGYNLYQNGAPVAYSDDSRCATLEPIDVSDASVVTFSFTNAIQTDTKKYIYSLFDGSTLVTRVSNQASGSTIDVSQGNKLYLCVYSSLVSVDSAETTTDIMLNLGSTVLPYEPYGYKIPISSGGVTTNIYLGSTQSTRQIKKYTFTGNETVFSCVSTTDGRNYCVAYRFADFGMTDIKDYNKEMQKIDYPIFISSHFVEKTNTYSDFNDIQPNQVGANTGGTAMNRYIIFCISGLTTAADYSAWFAQQYANGTPVEVYYILETPQTAAVNEPLMRIGNYADTISKSQSNLPIPTISGQNTLTIPTTISPSNVSLTLDQKEIEKIYEGGKKEVEFSGVPPISFNAIGSQLEDYLIEGNTSQNGTPSPEAPVDVQGCGERTSQLFNKDNFIDGGDFYPDAFVMSMKTSVNTNILLIPCKANTTYTVSRATGITHRFAMCFIATDQIVEGLSFTGYIISDGLVLSSTSADDSRFLCIYYAKHGGSDSSTPEETQQQLSEIMVNEGPVVLPYEPYGYKLPLTCGGVTTPIYLGQVPTMRKIRKIEFDGSENWIRQSVNDYGIANFQLSIPDRLLGTAETMLSSHFVRQTTSIGATQDTGFYIGGGAGKLLYLRCDSSIGTNLSDFLAWLAAQKTNGTPVSFWYVLAEPETAVVNEPLMKIGDYADSISKTQSNLSIPITTGSNTLSIETTIQPSNITINYNKQTEIAEVYGGIGENYPIYYMNRTIEGTSPIMFKGLGKDLKDYTILGDTSQNGTPTPEAPVDVQGVGVRSANLVSMSEPQGDGYLADYIIGIDTQGQPRFFSTPNFFVTEYLPVSAGTYYYYSDLYRATGGNASFIFYDANKAYIGNAERKSVMTKQETYELSNFSVPANAAYMRMSIDKLSTKNCLYASQFLPYEPYGYKLHVTINGTEYPIYLEQVPTTRRIKKLVLTGGENWNLSTINTHGIANFWFRISDRMQGSDGIGYCSHYEKQTASGAAATTEGFFSGATDALYIRVQSTTADTVEKFKDYISGKGVTIWYVMSEPETAVVNEPLMKIGDYADTISMVQAGVTIPTVAGANTLTIDTTVQPSEVSITGNIKEVST